MSRLNIYTEDVEEEKNPAAMHNFIKLRPNNRQRSTELRWFKLNEIANMHSLLTTCVLDATVSIGHLLSTHWSVCWYMNGAIALVIHSVPWLVQESERRGNY